MKNAYVTWQKSVDILGYDEKYNLEHGISKMWNWAKTQPQRKKIEWDSFELDKGKYSCWKTK